MQARTRKVTVVLPLVPVTARFVNRWPRVALGGLGQQTRRHRRIVHRDEDKPVRSDAGKALSCRWASRPEWRIAPGKMPGTTTRKMPLRAHYELCPRRNGNPRFETVPTHRHRDAMVAGSVGHARRRCTSRPLAMAWPMKSCPSQLGPRIATKISPARTRRESIRTACRRTRRDQSQQLVQCHIEHPARGTAHVGPTTMPSRPFYADRAGVCNREASPGVIAPDLNYRRFRVISDEKRAVPSLIMGRVELKLPRTHGGKEHGAHDLARAHRSRRP
jgi:hypothetical protein